MCSLVERRNTWQKMSTVKRREEKIIRGGRENRDKVAGDEMKRSEERGTRSNVEEIR